MKAKRITSLILALALALSLCLTGCGSQGGEREQRDRTPQRESRHGERTRSG